MEQQGEAMAGRSLTKITSNPDGVLGAPNALIGGLPLRRSVRDVPVVAVNMGGDRVMHAFA